MKRSSYTFLPLLSRKKTANLDNTPPTGALVLERFSSREERLLRKKQRPVLCKVR